MKSLSQTPVTFTLTLPAYQLELLRLQAERQLAQFPEGADVWMSSVLEQLPPTGDEVQTVLFAPLNERTWLIGNPAAPQRLRFKSSAPWWLYTACLNPLRPLAIASSAHKLRDALTDIRRRISAADARLGDELRGVSVSAADDGAQLVYEPSRNIALKLGRSH